MKTMPRRARRNPDQRRKASDPQIFLGSWVMRTSLESSIVMTSGCTQTDVPLYGVREDCVTCRCAIAHAVLHCASVSTFG